MSMHRWTTLILIAAAPFSVCIAWTGTDVSGLAGSVVVRDFIVPENGAFAGYPFILTEHDGVSELLWISDPAEPVLIGSFDDPGLDFSTRRFRLTLDPDGYPVIVGLSEGRCNIHRYQPGGWLPARYIPITGSMHVIRFVSSGELVIDYRSGINIRRCRVNTDTWNATDACESEGYYHTKWVDPYVIITEQTYLPIAPYIYLIDHSESSGPNTIEYRRLSNIPESGYSCVLESGMFTSVTSGDWLDPENWVVGWRFHDQSLRVKCAGSVMTDLGPAGTISADARPDGTAMIVWTDPEANRTLLTRFEGHGWSAPEIVMAAAPETVFLSYSNSNIWILCRYYPNWMIRTEQPIPATPTPDPDPPATFTPGPESVLIELLISDNDFTSGDTFESALLSYYPGIISLHDLPIFVVLEIGGSFFFGPEFTSTPSDYLDEIPSIAFGYRSYSVIPEFDWPDDCGMMRGVHLIAAVLNPDMTGLVSNLDIIEFGWH